MTYNLTNATNSSNIGNFMLEMNKVSDNWIFTTLLFSIMIITCIIALNSGITFSKALFISSLFSVFVGIIFLVLNAISWSVLAVLIGIAVFSLLGFLLGGN